MTALTIKGLSIRQPYATMIAARLKARETRDWATSHRGIVVIHAAKAWGREERDDLEHMMDFEPVQALFEPMLANGGKPPLGVLLCRAQLVRCERAEDIRDRLSPLERAAGGYADGRFAFLMEDVRPLPKPIPLKGQLGFFDVPLSLLQQDAAPADTDTAELLHRRDVLMVILRMQREHAVYSRFAFERFTTNLNELERIDKALQQAGVSLRGMKKPPAPPDFDRHAEATWMQRVIETQQRELDELYGKRVTS